MGDLKTAIARMSPVSHSLVNLFKRVVVIGAAVAVFQNPVSLLNGVGMVLATAGVACYSHASVKGARGGGGGVHVALAGVSRRDPTAESDDDDDLLLQGHAADLAAAPLPPV